MPRLLQDRKDGRSGRRKIGAALCTIALSPWLMAPGCADDAALNQFRDASAASLEAGLKQVFDGLIEGAFAAFVLGDDDSSSSGG